MPNFDARTVVLVAFLTISLLFIILFALYRGVGRTLPGLAFGVWSAFAWSIGAGLVMARGSIPNFLSIAVGNMAISGGILLMHSALRLTTSSEIQPVRTWLWSAPIIGAVAMGNLLIFGGYPSLLLFATGFNAILFLMCARLAWRARPIGVAMGFTGLALSVATVASATRLFIQVIGEGAAADAFDPSLFQRTYFSLMAFSVLSTLLGFTLITYERLNKILFAANSLLESEVAARTADLTSEIERKQALERSLSSTAEAERQRIGNELHDDLGQRLTGISLVAEALARELEKANKPLAVRADAIQRAASDAIAQVRGLAHGLMPVAPEPEGFSEALVILANASSVPGLVCQFEYEEPVDIKNQNVATNLFRIVQEALSNAIRHAKASQVAIRLDIISGKVHLSVADNGKGFEWPRAAAVEGAGHGLGLMAFRAALIHYRLDIESFPGRGSVIKVIEC